MQADGHYESRNEAYHEVFYYAFISFTALLASFAAGIAVWVLWHRCMRLWRTSSGGASRQRQSETARSRRIGSVVFLTAAFAAAITAGRYVALRPHQRLLGSLDASASRWMGGNGGGNDLISQLYAMKDDGDLIASDYEMRGSAGRPAPQSTRGQAAAAGGAPEKAGSKPAGGNGAESLRGAPLLFVTFVNAAYHDFFTNWYRSVKLNVKVRP